MTIPPFVQRLQRGLESVSIARKAPLFDLEIEFLTGLTAKGVDTDCRFIVVCLIHFVLE